MKKFVSLILLLPYSLNAYNAGILPYAKIKGRFHFLLGKEASGRSKGTWADFGGGGKNSETTEQTAIREFTEETKAAFSQFKNGGRVYPQNRFTEAQAKSDEYIRERIKPRGGITNPGPKKFYTLYLAQVDYLSPEEIMNGPYRHNEKDTFEWVDAQQFLNTLVLKNKFLKDYYNSLIEKKNSEFNPYFADKKIRRPFATYFIDPETYNIIRDNIGLHPRQTLGEADYTVYSKVKPSEEEIEWVESYEIRPEHRLPFEQLEEEEWAVTHPRSRPQQKPAAPVLPARPIPRTHNPVRHNARLLKETLKELTQKLRQLKNLLKQY